MVRVNPESVDRERRGGHAGGSAGNGTFTVELRPLYERGRPAAEASGEMDDAGKLLFVTFVTCYLLGRIFGGSAATAEVLVYGATAAFGLEYLMASWARLWQGG
jgi:hypothetical protein